MNFVVMFLLLSHTLNLFHRALSIKQGTNTMPLKLLTEWPKYLLLLKLFALAGHSPVTAHPEQR